MRRKSKEMENRKEKKKLRIAVKKLERPRAGVIILWILLIGSVSFGIYKNFTAIDIKTVHEKEIVEEKIVDTSNIESFVKNFAKEYHSWKNDSDSLNVRATALAEYLTEDLQKKDAEMVRIDCPTSAAVSDVQIWELEQKDSKTEYSIVYSVTQIITETTTQTVTQTDTTQELAEEEEPIEVTTEVPVEETKEVTMAYQITVYMDKEGNMVIVQNPTVCALPEKSAYIPEEKVSDGTVSTEDSAEITEFLQTLFNLYPTATEKELSYYAKDGVLKPVLNDSLVFDSLSDVIFTTVDEKVNVLLYVKYLDQNTKTTQISQYELVLEKGENWMITDVK